MGGPPRLSRGTAESEQLPVQRVTAVLGRQSDAPEYRCTLFRVTDIETKRTE